MQNDQPPDVESVAALRRMFADVANRRSLMSDAEAKRLQTQVCEVVHDMKAAGATPEAIVITIRRVATQENIGWGDRLLSKVVAWCVEEYFRE